MKNLKRVLSLALAGTMLSGMMAMGASAANKDFTDADEITHTEAVDVMSTLGVLKGNDDGTYAPERVVTRAEMAKIITVMLNGGNDPTLGSTSTVMFTDIQNHWAKSYIQYCANLGIIAGQGDGTFAPDAPVTGAAAAKMLLVALGYDADIAGYQGADWDLNVNRDANEAKLYEEIKTIDTSAGLSRDNTAQMAYNALEAKIMERTDHKVVGSGEVSYTYEQSKDTTFLNKYFDALTFIGSFEGNYNTQATGTKGYIAVKGRLDTDPATRLDNNNQEQPYYRATAQLPSDLDISNIGEEVKVIFKDGKGGRSNQPDKNDTIYGVFNTGRTEVVTDIRANVKDNKSNEKKVNIGGTKYDVADTVTVYTNYFANPAVYGTVPSGSTSAGTVAGSSTGGQDGKGVNSQLTDDLHAYNGDTIKAIVNPDTNKIDTVYITTSKIAAVTAKNATKITLNNNVGTLTVADHEVYEDVKKGDVVVVTTLYDNVGEDLSYSIVEKAETVNGTVKAYKGTETVSLDGTSYKIYGKAAMLNAIPDETVTSTFNDDSIGEEFTLYLVNGYVGAAVQTSESASNYSLVTAIRNTGNGSSAVFDALQLQVMDGAGTKTIISPNDDSVKADGTAATKQNDFKVGDIVVWSGKADDATVTVKAAAPNNTNYTYNDKTKSINGVVAASGCVLFAETTSGTVASANKGELTGAKYKVYDLRNLGAITNAVPTTYVTNSDGKIVAAFMDLAGTPSGAKDSTVYGIVSAYAGRVDVDGTRYYNYTVTSNEETYTVNINTNSLLSTGKLVSFEPTSDETYTSSDITVYADGWKDAQQNPSKQAAAVYVKEHDTNDKTLTYFTTLVNGGAGYEGKKDTQGTLALDDDCVIIWVDADGEEGGNDMGNLNTFDSVTGFQNAAIITEKDGTDWVIVAIFAETSNEANVFGGDTVSTAGTTVESVMAETTLANNLDLTNVLTGATAVKTGKLFNEDGDEMFDVGALLNGAQSTEAKVIEFTIPNAKVGDKVQVNSGDVKTLDGDKLQLIVGNKTAVDGTPDSITITHTPVTDQGDGTPVVYTVSNPGWTAAQ